MDYKTAEKHFTTSSPLRRRLDKMNSTWLHRETVHHQEPIHVRLYHTNIITFFPDNSFSINTGGYVTPATKDRFCRYLPKGCNVWFEYLPDKSFIAALHTPKGSRPYFYDARFTLRDFHCDDLDEMNDRDAWSVRTQIHDYVKAYMQRLVSTGLTAPRKPGDCVRCIQAVDLMLAINPDDDQIADLDRSYFSIGHYLEHLDQGTMPASLLLTAVRTSNRFSAAAHALFASARCLWKPARTLNDRLKIAEAHLMGFVAPRHDPRKCRRALRNALEMFLLERVGFERIQPHFAPRNMHRGESISAQMGW